MFIIWSSWRHRVRSRHKREVVHRLTPICMIWWGFGSTSFHQFPSYFYLNFELYCNSLIFILFPSSHWACISSTSCFLQINGWSWRRDLRLAILLAEFRANKSKEVSSMLAQPGEFFKIVWKIHLLCLWWSYKNMRR